jgi:hypothetical protein
MNTHKCRYGCDKVLVFDRDLPSPPFFEQDTGIHHTYKRCAEILGPKAKEAFARDAEERKAKKQQQQQK